MYGNWKEVSKMLPDAKGNTYGDANADALTLASEKLKDTFNDNTEWFGLEEEQEDTEEE